MESRRLLTEAEKSMIRQRSAFAEAEITVMEDTGQSPWSAHEIQILKAAVAIPGWSYNEIITVLSARTYRQCRAYLRLLRRRRVLVWGPGKTMIEAATDQSSGSGSVTSSADESAEDEDGLDEPPATYLSAAIEQASMNCNPDDERDLSSEEEYDSDEGEEPQPAEHDVTQDAVASGVNQSRGAQAEATLNYDSSSDDSMSDTDEEDYEEYYEEDGEGKVEKPRAKRVHLSADNEEEVEGTPAKRVRVSADNENQGLHAVGQTSLSLSIHRYRTGASRKEIPYSWRNPVRLPEDLPRKEYDLFTSFSAEENKILQKLVSAGKTAREVQVRLPGRSPKSIKSQIAHLYNFGLLPNLHTPPTFPDSDEEVNSPVPEDLKPLALPTRQPGDSQGTALPAVSQQSSHHQPVSIPVKPEEPSPARVPSVRASAAIESGISATRFDSNGPSLSSTAPQSFLGQSHLAGNLLRTATSDPTPPPEPMFDGNGSDDERDRLEEQELLRMKQELSALQRQVSRQNRAREMAMVSAEIQRLKQELGP